MREHTLEKLICDKLDSKIPILYIVSEDDERAVNYVRDYFFRKSKEVLIYDPSTKFSCDKEEQCGNDFVEIIEDWMESKYLTNKQLILRDFHRNLDDIKVISMIRQIIREYKQTQIILISNIVNIPRELEHYIVTLVSPLPDTNEIRKILGESLAKSDEIVNAAYGLEAIDIFQIKDQVLSESVNPSEQSKLFIQKKAEIVNRSRILSIEQAMENIDCLGGYAALKEWLNIQKSVLKNSPNLMAKGMLLLGITGCGKSLCAKVTAGVLNLPLIRMEFGRIVNKYVGESERNLYKALRIVEAMAPCVLWLDEFEKAIGGDGDNEVNQRLIGIFLTWMQERQGNIFIVATVNNVSKLPAELLRRGRFDKIYYVDLPKDDEIKEIFKIHAKKLGISISDDKKLAGISKKLYGYSGADIEFVLQEAKRMEIHERSKIQKADIYIIIEKCIDNTHPISIMLRDEVENMRAEFTKRRFDNVNGITNYNYSNENMLKKKRKI